MVNLRFHIVSLVAVFLALAVGVIAGSTVIDQGIVNALRAQSESFRTARDAARAQADRLEQRLEVWERFGAELVAARIDDALRGRPVVLVTGGTVGTTMIHDIEDTIVAAEGTVPGRIALTSRWRLDGAGDAEALAEALSAEGAGAGDGALALARRLRRPERIGEEDLLTRLEHARFIQMSGIGGRRFPPADALVLVVVSTSSADGPDPEPFALPFLRSLSTGLPTTVAEPIDAERSLVDLVRRDGPLRLALATIDHIDTSPGRYAMIDALARIATGRRPPHYGIRGGATAVAPQDGA